jgi:hypothetical protein
MNKFKVTACNAGDLERHLNKEGGGDGVVVDWVLYRLIESEHVASSAGPGEGPSMMFTDEDGYRRVKVHCVWRRAETGMPLGFSVV